MPINLKEQYNIHAKLILIKMKKLHSERKAKTRKLFAFKIFRY